MKNRLWWSRRILPTIALLVCMLAGARPCTATIRYEVSLSHPEQHLFHVTMTIPDVTGEIAVQIPAWNALYQIRDFASHVQRVEAFAGTASAPIEKVDKETWRVTGKERLRFATQLIGTRL